MLIQLYHTTSYLKYVFELGIEAKIVKLMSGYKRGMKCM